MATETIAGRYRLDAPLGSSAMSEVWRAQDLELERQVAIKLIAADADTVRFEREARSAAALAHPHIAQLYDFGRDGDRLFMVLEYLAGGTLETLLGPDRPLPDADAARIAGEIASGLAHAHSRGVVHRDLKPANILFDAEGRAKIADFGIARLGHAGTITEAGTVLGTATTISPEQAAGRPATPASDVYSFGVILYRLLTGRLPFVSSSAVELAAMHRDAEPPAIATLRKDAPAGLAAVATAALAKDPAQRPADGEALAAALAPAIPALVPGQGERDATRVLAAAPRPRRRRAVLGSAVALALLAIAGVGVGFAVTRGGGSSAAPATTSRRTSSNATPTAAPITRARPAAIAATAASTAARTTTRAHRRKRAAVATATVVATVAPPVTTAPPPATTAPPPATTAPPSTTTAPATDTTATTAPATTTGP